jgi:hypothetical protein
LTLVPRPPPSFPHRYDGDWWENQRHGLGTYRWPNGRWREGTWIKGKRLKWISEERIGGLRRNVQRRGGLKTTDEKKAD